MWVTVDGAVPDQVVPSPLPDGDTAITVVWDSSSNGSSSVVRYVVNIRQYTIKDGKVNIDSIEGCPLELSGTVLQHVVANLEPLVPYDVQLVAGNVAGCGEPVTSQPFFTREGEPQMPPHDVKVERLNGTVMNVSWTKLSIVEAQSITVSYVVSYSFHNGHKRQVKKVVLPASQSYVVISGLDPGTIYQVEVFASNEYGQSKRSDAEYVDPDRPFQLRLSGIATNCHQWVEDDNKKKLEGVTTSLQMELVELCHCQYATDHITKESFVCFSGSEEYVTFRAQLSSTADADSTTLLRLIEGWVSTGPNIHVNSVLRRVDKDCHVAISDFHEGECVMPTTDEVTAANPASSQSDNTAAIVGGTVAISASIIVTTAVIIVIALFMRFRRKRHEAFNIEQCSMIPLQEPRGGECTGTILTNPNVACGMAEQGRGVGEEKAKYNYFVVRVPHSQWLSHPQAELASAESYVVPDPPKYHEQAPAMDVPPAPQDGGEKDPGEAFQEPIP